MSRGSHFGIYLASMTCSKVGGHKHTPRLENVVMESSQRTNAITFHLFGIFILIVLVVAVGYFHFARNQEVARVREARVATAERGPRIEVVTTEEGPSQRAIKLLGDVRSNATTTLFGKVSGYISAISVDKGDRVEAGQIVAEVTSRELDQQYASAAADLVNKRRNLVRARELFERGNTTEVAKLQAETDTTMAENNVAVLATMKGYQIVQAPFPGRVTARFVDPGAFITSGSNASRGVPALADPNVPNPWLERAGPSLG
jgi:membrane fusion protein (multidrug efflux system)